MSFIAPLLGHNNSNSNNGNGGSDYNGHLIDSNNIAAPSASGHDNNRPRLKIVQIPIKSPNICPN